MPRKKPQPTQSTDWPRANPEDLAKFDPSTKVCVMNCGPSTTDPRSKAERRFLCTDCEVLTSMNQREAFEKANPPPANVWWSGERGRYVGVADNHLTNERYQGRWEGWQAATEQANPTGGRVPDDDALVELVQKFPGITGVVREQWKDGLSIDVPTADLRNFVRALLATQQPPEQQVRFQARVDPWLIECFGEEIARDKTERNHRFLEEALELVQATGCTEVEANELVSYVYGRDVGDPPQEVGGVMVTLGALCLANGMDMHEAGETELARIWTKVSQIREKQKSKPAMSPLPGVYPDREKK